MKRLFTNPRSSFVSAKPPVKPSFKNWKLFLPAIVAFLVSSGAFAQIIVDGNPTDWTNFTTSFSSNAFAPDVFNAVGNTDDQFTQGTKDASLVSQMRWSNGSANAKGDIANAGAVQGQEQDPAFPNDPTKKIHYLYFFADRHAINGDAAVGFWFYKTPVNKNTNGTFSGAHETGDLLIISHFTNGGGQSDVFEYQWDPSAGKGNLVFKGNFGTAQVNSTPFAVPQYANPLPAGYVPYIPKFSVPGFGLNTYPTGAFFEGKVKLQDIYGLNAPVCFSSFLAETRNSQSITASLQDFALGGFTSTVAMPVVTITEASLCGDATACVTIVGSKGGTYTMSQPSNSNYNGGTPKEITITNDGDPVAFCDLQPGGKFSVFYTTPNGCSSAPRTCDNLNDIARISAPANKPQSSLGKAENKDLIAYPVPFSESVTVEFKASKAEHYVINLYDLQGHLVRELQAGNAKAGEIIKVEVSGTGMAESMYLVRKVSKSGISTVKLLKKE